MEKIGGRAFFVTGGAGFIGSNIAQLLLQKGAKVIVYDNLSSGKEEFASALVEEGAEFIRGDVLDKQHLSDSMKGKGIDAVVHLAANPNVKLGALNPIEQGIVSTYNVLEAIRENGIGNILFSSSGSIYGYAGVKPTPEDYGPLKPVSIYGAMKLGSEALISAYSNLYKFNFYIFRFANVIGRHATHGVIFDFVKKLRSDGSHLDVLGNGGQKKSYIYVEDCINGILHVYGKSEERENIFNLASNDQISVREIAEMVVDKVAPGAVIKYGDTKEGWAGDITDNFISNRKAREFGFSPGFSSREAVARTIDDIIGKG